MSSSDHSAADEGQQRSTPSESRIVTRKRRTSSSVSKPPAKQRAVRKGRACQTCKRLKVKCDSFERHDSICSRCSRLKIECVLETDPVTNPDERRRNNAAFQRLDTAVEEILKRLNMPRLETFGSDAAVNVMHLDTGPAQASFQATRENSQEPAPDGETHMAHAPMGSLFEVTHLRSLRSRLYRHGQNNKGSRHTEKGDLISAGVIGFEDAEGMFDVFKKSLSRYLFAATVQDDASLNEVRRSSTLLLTAILLVTSLHIPSKSNLYNICYKTFLDLVAASMFDRSHNLDDIRALCIGAFWLPDLSWKLSGHCIRIATELNLHHAFYRALYSLNITQDDRKDAYEKARLWYLLYVLDHHFSIAYGRPPVTAELQPIQEYERYLDAPYSTPSDRRLMSQVSLFVILSRVYTTFGLEAERMMDDSEVSLRNHAAYNADLDGWKATWEHRLAIDQYVGDYPAKGVFLHYYFGKLQVNALALRGRSLSDIGELPTALRPMARSAIDSAHSVLRVIFDEPTIKRSLVGVPLYLHAAASFAVVFLIKMFPRWGAIGVSIDPQTQTLPLIRRIIDSLRQVEAGSNHIVYAMAKGFEKMLQRSLSSRSSQPGQGSGGSIPTNLGKDGLHPINPNQQPDSFPGQPLRPPHFQPYPGAHFGGMDYNQGNIPAEYNISRMPISNQDEFDATSPATTLGMPAFQATIWDSDVNFAIADPGFAYEGMQFLSYDLLGSRDLW